jgi:hypothetical protein
MAAEMPRMMTICKVEYHSGNALSVYLCSAAFIQRRSAISTAVQRACAAAQRRERDEWTGCGGRRVRYSYSKGRRERRLMWWWRGRVRLG